MNILTPENYTFDMNQVIDYVPQEMYSILDVSTISNVDFYFKNILFTITYTCLSAEIQIGKHCIEVPLKWQILLGDEDTGMVEMCTIEDILNMKHPHAFVFNPISSMYPKYEPVTLLRVYTYPIKWQIPMVSQKALLTVPIEYGHKPDCVFFADENAKIPELHLGF